MSRRLPVFLVLDVSESMVGKNLDLLQEGIRSAAARLRTNPHNLEKVFISVIVFAGRARTLVPLVPLYEFAPPELPIGGGTGLGAALDHLMKEIDASVQSTTAERKGDWKPCIFLLTDGRPTDTPGPQIERWNGRYRTRAHLVSVSIGGDADAELLARLSSDVLILQSTQPDSFVEFIKWVTNSIELQSASVAMGKDDAPELAKPAKDLLSRFDLAKPAEGDTRIDERFAVFTAKCQASAQPYLIKYERTSQMVGTKDPSLAGRFGLNRYDLQAVHRISHSYFELTGPEGAIPTVNSSLLRGVPACPYCHTAAGLAVCCCGKVHCVTEEGVQKCPWCGQTGEYGSSTGGVDITRGQG